MQDWGQYIERPYKEVLDVMEALTLLTKAYINMCGYSLGYRTVVYCAGEAWQERLAHIAGLSHVTSCFSRVGFF